VVEYLHSCLAGPGIDRLLAYNARERLRRKHHRGSLRRSIFRILIQLSGGLGGSRHHVGFLVADVPMKMWIPPIGTMVQ
jgi:hypothetical protein